MSLLFSSFSKVRVYTRGLGFRITLGIATLGLLYACGAQLGLSWEKPVSASRFYKMLPMANGNEALLLTSETARVVSADGSLGETFAFPLGDKLARRALTYASADDNWQRVPGKNAWLYSSDSAAADYPIGFIDAEKRVSWYLSSLALPDVDKTDSVDIFSAVATEDRIALSVRVSYAFDAKLGSRVKYYAVVLLDHNSDLVALRKVSKNGTIFSIPESSDFWVADPVEQQVKVMRVDRNLKIEREYAVEDVESIVHFYNNRFYARETDSKKLRVYDNDLTFLKTVNPIVSAVQPSENYSLTKRSGELLWAPTGVYRVTPAYDNINVSIPVVQDLVTLQYLDICFFNIDFEQQWCKKTSRLFSLQLPFTAQLVDGDKLGLTMNDNAFMANGVTVGVNRQDIKNLKFEYTLDYKLRFRVAYELFNTQGARLYSAQPDDSFTVIEPFITTACVVDGKIACKTIKPGVSEGAAVFLNNNRVLAVEAIKHVDDAGKEIESARIALYK